MKARPAASSPSQSSTSSTCQSAARVRLAQTPARAPRPPRVDRHGVAQVGLGDASGLRSDARNSRRLRYGRAPRRVGAGLHALVERQVLEGVQRVVVHEHADRALVGQQAGGPDQRPLDRIVGERVVCPRQCPPPGWACARSMPTTVTLILPVGRVFDEGGDDLLHVVVDVLAGPVDQHLLAVVDVFRAPRRCPAWRRTCRRGGSASASARHRRARRPRRASSSRRARTGCRRRCRRSRP